MRREVSQTNHIRYIDDCRPEGWEKGSDDGLTTFMLISVGLWNSNSFPIANGRQ